FGTAKNAGANPPSGAVFNYYLQGITDSTKATVRILDKNRKEIKRFATDAKEKSAKFDITDGVNQFNWDLRYPEAEKIEGMILWNGTPGGIIAPPGSYYAVLKVNTDSVEVPFTVKPDPNYKETQQEYEEQFKFLSEVENKFNE